MRGPHTEEPVMGNFVHTAFKHRHFLHGKVIKQGPAL